MKSWLWAAIVVVCCGLLSHQPLGGGEKDRSKPAGKEAKPAALRTRIRLLNLTYVVKGYNKYKDFTEEARRAFEPYQERARELSKELDKLNKMLEQPEATEEEKEDVKSRIEKLKRQIDDNKAEAKKVLGKRAGEQMFTIYKDIEAAATRYARKHDVDLVLHYNDATTERDYYSQANIERKLQSGALMPLFAAPGMDISKEIVDNLNDRMDAGKGASEPDAK